MEVEVAEKAPGRHTAATTDSLGTHVCEFRATQEIHRFLLPALTLRKLRTAFRVGDIESARQARTLNACPEERLTAKPSMNCRSEAPCPMPYSTVALRVALPVTASTPKML